MAQEPIPFQSLRTLPIPPEALVDPQAAALFLGGLSVLTLADWRCRGMGPRFCKAGRLVRYRLSDLQVWLEGRTYRNTSEGKKGA